MEDNPLLLLTFLSLFHIFGAIALGYAVRVLWKKLSGDDTIPAFTAIFLLVWGSMFGCIPFAFGMDPVLPAWFPMVQIGVWGTTFVISAFLGQTVMRWAKPLLNAQVMLMVMGGIFMLAGIGAGRAMWLEGDAFQAMIFVLIFGAIGTLIFALGLVGLLKSNRV